MTSHPELTYSIDGEGSRSGGAGRILIVDDRPDKQLILEAALASLGHEIVVAGSGRDALRWLLRHEFAVILLDVNMPGMDGFETARLIRRRPRNRQTPIIFVTAYGDDPHALQGYSLGAVDFILSPVIPEVLRSKVGVLLELHQCTSEMREQAERLRKQAGQLQALTRASLSIHRALSIDGILRIATDAAREIVGTTCACALVAADQAGFPQRKLSVSPQDFAIPQAEIPSAAELRRLVSRLSADSRHTAAELEVSAMRLLEPEVPKSVPLDGLTAPFCGREGETFGVLLVAGKRTGPFVDDDESLLIQLAQMAATAIENSLFVEAREANRVKDEFLATLSHELRTPLSAILGWTQLLRTQVLDAGETGEALEIIERNGHMQHKLIEDLLDVSRIVTGKMQLNLRPIRLSEVIRAAVDVILPAAQAKQLTIDVSLDANADSVCGDADRLQQVLWNLLSNAVKFTPARGRIDVQLEAAGDQAHLAVRDTGEGIAAEFLPYVFDRFRQADSSASRHHGGLGIGLAIVRHVVELHGGTVRARSEGSGKGTTIVLVLPLAPVTVGDQGVATASRNGGEKVRRLDAELDLPLVAVK